MTTDSGKTVAAANLPVVATDAPPLWEPKVVNQRLQAPSWREFPNFPVVVITALLAIAITIAWWTETDISMLLETAAIRRGQLWRLLTTVFPHLDILHLAFNVYWLWFFGTSVEKIFGHARTAGLFVVLAIGSNSLDFAFDRGGVGLSGIGYGLFGLLWILSKRDERFRTAMDSRTVQVFIAWFFLCIVLTMGHQYAVANVAHAAGALFGILIGFAISTPKHRTVLSAAVAVLLLFGLSAATFARPWVNLSPYGGYEEANLGYEDLVAGKNQEAIRWLRDATVYKPKDPTTWYNLGLAYARVGDTSSANAAFGRAHDLEPNDSRFATPSEK
jgi:membrane associated rhomboid family serine protease